MQALFLYMVWTLLGYIFSALPFIEFFEDEMSIVLVVLSIGLVTSPIRMDDLRISPDMLGSPNSSLSRERTGP